MPSSWFVSNKHDRLTNSSAQIFAFSAGGKVAPSGLDNDKQGFGRFIGNSPASPRSPEIKVWRASETIWAVSTVVTSGTVIASATPILVVLCVLTANGWLSDWMACNTFAVMLSTRLCWSYWIFCVEPGITPSVETGVVPYDEPRMASCVEPGIAPCAEPGNTSRNDGGITTCSWPVCTGTLPADWVVLWDIPLAGGPLSIGPAPPVTSASVALLTTGLLPRVGLPLPRCGALPVGGGVFFLLRGILQVQMKSASILERKLNVYETLNEWEIPINVPDNTKQNCTVYMNCMLNYERMTS